MAKETEPKSTRYEEMKAWAESPEGKQAMATVAENHRKRMLASQPGTPEYYERWKVQQDAIRQWDEGPFI